ncbi:MULTISPECIES: extracellular solute-binding protein [Streptacidiphilus]|uniref:Extracellular solute-binding protein n=2 Tax=Streptacidiphilus TaxID=228398 RepID=A0ABV6UEA0_9ACTN|nr:extracellular solute-binding protein [Streptacidiphilus jeojiense]
MSRISRTGRGTALLAAATAVAALAGCSSSSTSGSSTGGAAGGGKTTISFMQIMGTGTQKSTLVKLTDDFEKANPDVTVNLEYEPDYGTLLAKETAAVAAHNAPTIGQAYESWAATFANAKAILPVSTYAGSDTPAGLSDFYTGVQNDLKLPDGKLWMWPFNKSVQVLFYNQDMLKAKGLTAPTTWTQFATEAKAVSGNGVTAISVDPGSTASGVGGGTVLFQALAAANGTPDFAKDGTPQLNSAAAVQSLAYLADLKKSGALAVGTNYPGETALGAKKGAFDMSSAAGYYYENQAVGGKFTLGTEVLPTGSSGPSNIMTGTNLVMFASASAAQQKAGWAYMQFLASASSQAQWSSSTGYLPVTSKALPLMSSFLAKNPYMNTAVAALEYAVAEPPYSWVAKAEDEEIVAVQDVLEKGADPKTALDTAQTAALADQKAAQ